MMTRSVVVSLVSSTVLLSACARVDIRPATSEQLHDPTVTGLRCYMPVPYLLVVAASDDDGKTRYDVNVVSLPDVEHPLIADVKPGWGSVNGSFSIDEKGILTSVGAEMDSKVPETIASIAAIVAPLIAQRSPGKPAVPKAYLLKIMMRDGQLALGKPVEITIDPG